MQASGCEILLRCHANDTPPAISQDEDKSGTLSRKEIEAALMTWNIPVDEGELDELFLKCDTDRSGQLSYEEFTELIKQAHAKKKF